MELKAIKPAEVLYKCLSYGIYNKYVGSIISAIKAVFVEEFVMLIIHSRLCYGITNFNCGLVGNTCLVTQRMWIEPRYRQTHSGWDYH